MGSVNLWAHYNMAQAGYSGTPLVKKLGIKPGAIAYVRGVPEHYFDSIFPLPEGVVFKSTPTGDLDFVHLFVYKQAEFKKQFVSAMKHMRADAMLWISWPKKSSKVPSDLDENIIRDFGLASGLVDVKVCAIDEIWSGLKFVIRTKDRT